MATPRTAREGRGLVTFATAACCTEISFTHIALALRLHNYLQKTAEEAYYNFTVDLHLVISYWSCDNTTHVTEYCTVIGHALNRASQQTAIKVDTRPLPLLWNGVWPCETSIVHVKFIHSCVQSFDDGGNMTIEGCGLQALFCSSLVPRPFLYGRSGNYTSFVQPTNSHRLSLNGYRMCTYPQKCAFWCPW